MFTAQDLDTLKAIFVNNMSDGTCIRYGRQYVLIISDLAAISMCGGDKSLIGPMARAMIQEEEVPRRMGAGRTRPMPRAR